MNERIWDAYEKVGRGTMDAFLFFPVSAMDNYVHDKPWKSMGYVAVAG